MFKSSLYAFCGFFLSAYSIQAMDLSGQTKKSTKSLTYQDLFTILKNDDFDELKALIESKKVDISRYNKMFPATPTLLHEAISLGSAKCAKILIITPSCDIASPNITDLDTPLHMAAQKGDIQTVEALFEESGKRNLKIVDRLNKQKDTPLHLAVIGLNNYKENFAGQDQSEVQKNFLELATKLIASGASVTAKNDNHKTPLHSAIDPLYFSFELLNILLDKNEEVKKIDDLILYAIKTRFDMPFNWSEEDKTLYSRTIMHNLIYKLILKGACIDPALFDGVSTICKDTPLHKAAREGYYSIVELFLKHRVKADAIRTDDNNGNITPLEDIFRALAIKNDSQLKHEISEEYKKTIQILLLNKADIRLYEQKAIQIITAPNYRHKNTIFPLHNPLILRDKDLVKFLLNNNVSVDLNVHETPLHVAIRCNYSGVAKLFLDWGANLALLNIDKQTPLELAYELKNHEIIDMIHDKIDQTTPSLSEISKTYGNQCWRAVFMKRHGSILRKAGIATCLASAAAYVAYKGWLSDVNTCMNFLINYF